MRKVHKRPLAFLSLPLPRTRQVHLAAIGPGHSYTMEQSGLGK